MRPGEVLLGKFRVEEVLGKGGMGVVVAVRHMELGERFAIKFLLAKGLQAPGARERFQREARAAARLKSEHVAKVFDVGRLDGDVPYILMEHLDGTDLKSLLRERGPLSLEETINYVTQTCDAIAEAHALGIVHRDLKPSNLFLVRRPNGSMCVKVIDFGISKLLDPDDTELGKSDLTKSGAILGTPLYMSPEQLMHSKTVDERSDIWSMGIILFELLTGKVPFEGDTFPQLVGHVLTHPPPRLCEVSPALPSWIEAVVMRCLEKPPQRRFPTIGELSKALQARESAPVPKALAPSIVARPRMSQPDRSIGMSTTLDLEAGPARDLKADEALAEESTIVEHPTGLTRPEASARPAQGRGRVWPWVGLVAVGAVLALLLSLWPRSSPQEAQVPPIASPSAAAPPSRPESEVSDSPANATTASAGAPEAPAQAPTGPPAPSQSAAARAAAPAVKKPSRAAPEPTAKPGPSSTATAAVEPLAPPLPQTSAPKKREGVL